MVVIRTHYVGRFTKSGIIVAVIVIDILLIFGSIFFVFQPSIHFGLLEFPIVIGAFSYAIGGNMITYNMIKSCLLNLKTTRKSKTTFRSQSEWDLVKKELKGQWALVGITLFLILISISIPIFAASKYMSDPQIGIVKLIAIFVPFGLIFLLILPLLGKLAKKWGHENEFSWEGY